MPDNSTTDVTQPVKVANLQEVEAALNLLFSDVGRLKNAVAGAASTTATGLRGKAAAEIAAVAAHIHDWALQWGLPAHPAVDAVKDTAKPESPSST